MVSSRKVSCSVFVMHVEYISVGACTCKCDNVHSCMDTCTCMFSSAHSCGCVANGRDAMVAF